MDSLAQQVLDNERERRTRRKGPGFSVVANSQNPPRPWNDMRKPLKLILSAAVRAKLGLKSSRKMGSSAPSHAEIKGVICMSTAESTRGFAI